MISIPGIEENNLIGNLIDGIRTSNTIEIEGDNFKIDSEVYRSFRKIYEYFLSDYIDKEMDLFKRGLTERLSFFSPLKTHKIQLLSNIIVTEFGSLEELNNELCPFKNRFLDPSIYKSFWDIEILNSGIILIKILKAEAAGQINSASPEMSASVVNKNIVVFINREMVQKKMQFIGDMLDAYPISEKMRKIYLAIVIGQKINYLQQYIKELEVSSDTKVNDFVTGFTTALTDIKVVETSDQKEISIHKEIKTAEEELPEFKNIFLKPEYFVLATDALIELGVINENGIGLLTPAKMKGVVRLWYTILKNNGYLNFATEVHLSERDLPKVLNKHFNKIGYQLFSERTEGKPFRNRPTEFSIKKYWKSLNQMLPKFYGKS